MKIAPILFILFFLVIPVYGFADCSKNGTTVVYINGIFGDINSAKADKNNLEKQYKAKVKNQDVDFINGYNESHAWGIDDVISSAIQMYAKSAEDHDFVDILNQVHGDLKTQKILLLGYSQGSFYSNAIYDYLVKNGVDKNSIAVYNVATPADRVAGPEGHPGKYLTSSTDRVVGGVVSGLAKVGAGKPLPANITLPIQKDEESDPFGGHYFSKDYLALAPDRIISDIDQELNNLIAGTENKEECFIQPKMGVAYYISDTGYYILDTMAKNGRALATSPYTPEQMASMGNSLFQGVYNWSSQFFSEVAGYFQQNNLFGASLASVVNQNNSQQQPALETQPAQENLLVAEENNNGTGGPDVNPTNQLEVQDLLDNIQERLDIISQQVQVLVAQQEQNNQNNYGTVASQNQSNNQTADNAETNTNTNASTNINTGAGVGGGGGSGYLKILISEVQINPIAQRFVELYNPNSSSVVLTGWYLQRKDKNDTSWGSLVSSNNFGVKEIPAHGYFIVSRQILNSNILSDITLSNDNSLALKNPNGEISDKVGFGSAIDPEFSVTINPSTGQSIGRKWDLINNTEIDTDNNSTDFEADSPTPQAQNISLPPDPTLQVSCLASPSSGDTTQQISFVSSVTGGSGVYTHSWTGDCVASTANCQKIFSTAGNYTVNLSVSSGSQTQTANCSVAVSAFVPGKVLITEVQMQGANVHQDFIELYNPSVTDTVYLNNYRLVKRAQTSSGDTTIKSWAGDAVSKILPQQYYLWVSSTEAGYPASISADVSTQQNISSNNGIGLRYGAEDTGELVDSVGWGTFSNVLFEGTAFSQNHAQNFSLGRKFSSGIYQDADNNSTDFEIDTPTPKAQNITYVLLPSSDATITSTTYNVSALAGGAGTIVNVPYATSKTVFETALTKNESHQTWNDTGLSNPIATGNTLVVTAQDGTTSATYTVTVDTTNWSQGTVDSFTPAGSFTFHTGNFMPNQQTWCGFSLGYFISIYPARTNGGFFGYGPCKDTYPSYTIDMSGFGTTVGEYDFYISYCGGHDCASAPYGDVIGNYYRTYFDGTTWSAIAVDNSKTRLSSDAKVTALNYYLVSTLSANYTAGVYSSGTGTIKNVRLGTSKTDFKSALTPASGATLEDSGLTNPILTGNTLVVTAQDGVTKATYTITADTVAWSQGTINSYTSAGKFYLDTSFFTDNQSIGCNLYLYQSLYPLQTNEQEEGSFPCGGNNGTRPVYTLDMASFTAVGDYTIWMSDQSINSGRYYEIHFDGTVWSSLSSVAADTTPPTGTITINSGALYTNTRNVTLTLSATDDSSGVAQMQFNNGTGAYSSLEAYSTTKSWELSASGDGAKTVRVKFKDNAGNETVTGIPATITLDTTAPVIALNGNATINLAVGDSYSELGATATDNIDSTDAVAIAGDTVSTLAPATFHITYDAVDNSGNHATQVVRTVVVN